MAKANTLLQHWLVNYICHKFDDFTSGSILDRVPRVGESHAELKLAATRYKDTLFLLLDNNYSSDENFLVRLSETLAGILLTESRCSQISQRGNSLLNLISSLDWLIAPDIEHEIYGQSYSITSLFKKFSLLDINISIYMDARDLEFAQFPRYELLVLKRNIAEYILDHLFRSRYEGATFWVNNTAEVSKGNIQVLSELATAVSSDKRLCERDVNYQRALVEWNTKKFIPLLQASLRKLNELRADSYWTIAADVVRTASYRLQGSDDTGPNTQSMQVIHSVLALVNQINYPASRGKLDFCSLIQKPFSVLQGLPELAVRADEGATGARGAAAASRLAEDADNAVVVVTDGEQGRSSVTTLRLLSVAREGIAGALPPDAADPGKLSSKPRQPG